MTADLATADARADVASLLPRADRNVLRFRDRSDRPKRRDLPGRPEGPL